MSCGECGFFEAVEGIKADGVCLWGLGKVPFWLLEKGERVYVDQGDGAHCEAFESKGRKRRSINTTKTYTREAQA